MLIILHVGFSGGWLGISIQKNDYSKYVWELPSNFYNLKKLSENPIELYRDTIEYQTLLVNFILVDKKSLLSYETIMSILSDAYIPLHIWR